jgi:twitching motility protein PilT
LKIIDILKMAMQNKASDIHLTPESRPMFRINGELMPAFQQPLSPETAEEMANELMDEQQRKQLLERGEVDFSYTLTNIARFRINIFKQREQVALAIRIIPAQAPQMEMLGLPKIINELISKPQGLLLITGPTGSGKSTTLAAIIDYINRTMRKHIITLEDPIEFVHQNVGSIINQRQVGVDTSSFASGLRAALRQDPDVVLVGELRDLETMSIAITAAETGHLVLATLHTSDAPQTIDRIIDVFPADSQAQIRIQLSSVLISVIAQRLLPTIDGRGRTAAFEVLINTPAVANLIRSEKAHQLRSVLQTSRAIGMQTMEMSLRELVQNQIVSVEAAKKVLTTFANEPGI